MMKRTVLLTFLFSLSLVALLTGTETSAAKSRQVPTVAQFDRIVSGNIGYNKVIKILGRPLWSYNYQAVKNSIPVQLPESGSSSAISVPKGKPRKLENLRVLKYKAKFPQDYYYVVLKKGKVYYTIGPVPKDEQQAKEVQQRYGKPEIVEDSALHGHRMVIIDVAWYRKHGIAFLKSEYNGPYTAKLVIAPKN